MSSKPCGELYCHALSYCDMCGRLPLSTEYKSEVSGPQGAGAALCVLCKKLLSCFHLTFGYLSATIITVGQFQGVLRTKQSVGEGFVDK